MEMAHPTGFEPVAFAFGGQRSIQLSYGCLSADLASAPAGDKVRPSRRGFPKNRGPESFTACPRVVFRQTLVSLK